MNQFVIVAGGPGYKLPCDKNHDQSWSNYVDAVLLMASRGELHDPSKEEVHWFVYEKAYLIRWHHDVQNGNPSVGTVQKKGFATYNHLLRQRASDRGFKYVAIAGASDFWTRLKGLRAPISRVWFFGHARQNLWLRLDHDDSCSPTAPDSDEMIRWSSIPTHGSVLFPKFVHASDYHPDYSSRFYGCNTVRFARTWATTFGVYAEGGRGTLDFEKTRTDLDPTGAYEASCAWKRIDPTGTNFE